MLWNPNVGAEPFDAADAAQEVQSPSDVVKEHRVAFCPSLLLRRRNERDGFVDSGGWVVVLSVVSARVAGCVGGENGLNAFVNFLPPSLNCGDGSRFSCFQCNATWHIVAEAVDVVVAVVCDVTG